MPSVDISQSSLSLAFMAASEAQEALSVMLGFVPQFFATRAQVMGLLGPSFAYVRVDETNNGQPTLYFWDGALLKQVTSTADISAAVAAAAAAATSAATATSEAGIATGAASTATSEAGAASASAAQRPDSRRIAFARRSGTCDHRIVTASPVGLYLVLADETRGGSPSHLSVLFNSLHWLAITGTPKYDRQRCISDW